MYHAPVTVWREVGGGESEGDVRKEMDKVNPAPGRAGVK